MNPPTLLSPLLDHRQAGKRPVTIFTGQWANLPRLEMFKKAKGFGYDGIEIACWGDHLDVERALNEPAYIPQLRRELAEHGLKCFAISAHLVGQAVCDNIDLRHQQILPPRVWGDGDSEGVRQRAAEEMKNTAKVAAKLGVKVVNGFTGSSIWHLCYSFPPNLPGQIDVGYQDFANRWTPILDVFAEYGIRFALEVHPTEIAFDIASTKKALEAVKDHPAFGFNFDPSHFAYQGVNYIKFIRLFGERIFHVHMKDVAWNLGDEAGVFGGHEDFHQPHRFWDFKSVGRGNVNFELIIRALNDVGYFGPLSVEWEDGAMDRDFGAKESCDYVKKIDFPPSKIVFDAQFAEKK